MLDKLLDYSPNLGMDALLLLPVLIALEVVLSADNAIALAAIAQGLSTSALQRQALNVGLVAAFVLRIILILTATWVVRYWQFELLGALYLLWLVFQYFTSEEDGDHEHHGPRFSSLWQAIPMIAVTDLAFSLDSVTTAIALSEEIWLVLTGGLIGVITLRFMAGLFIRWLDEYVHLEDAGFITVGLVGLRLLIRVIHAEFVPPQWLMVLSIAALFTWGFSKRTDQQEQTVQETSHGNGRAALHTAPDSTAPGHSRPPGGNAAETGSAQEETLHLAEKPQTSSEKEFEAHPNDTSKATKP